MFVAKTPNPCYTLFYINCLNNIFVKHIAQKKTPLKYKLYVNIKRVVNNLKNILRCKANSAMDMSF